ncbi:MAG: hypothetical protein PHQ19_01830 [Candidatus Krumholzibacteria bacterium]|nr:hypothetical protein [Candidatus Krumholzibacteria bacterium]
MNRGKNERLAGGGMCLSEKILRTLAIRLSEKAGQRGTAEEGPPDRIPGDLFAGDEKDMREHIDRCTVCRKRLLEEIYSLFRVREAFGDPANEERFEAAVRGAVLVDETRGEEVPPLETVLFPDPYDERGAGPALAAASGGSGERPLRYSSADGKIVLRQYAAPGDPRPRFRLIADDPRLAAGAEVVIGGRTYTTDASGCLDLPDERQAPAFGARIVVRSRSV